MEAVMPENLQCRSAHPDHNSKFQISHQKSNRASNQDWTRQYKPLQLLKIKIRFGIVSAAISLRSRSLWYSVSYRWWLFAPLSMNLSVELAEQLSPHLSLIFTPASDSRWTWHFSMDSGTNLHLQVQDEVVVWIEFCVRPTSNNQHMLVFFHNWEVTVIESYKQLGEHFKAKWKCLLIHVLATQAAFWK